jgi:hypothetical protein
MTLTRPYAHAPIIIIITIVTEASVVTTLLIYKSLHPVLGFIELRWMN